MEHILVVEDSRIVRSMIVHALSRLPEITVHEAATMAEARRFVEVEGYPIFAALVDLVLPDAIHGEVIPWISGHQVPAIVFTSEINEDIRRTLIREGVVDYIVKRDSLAVDQVVTVVENLLRNRNYAVLAVDDSITMRRFFEETLRNYCFTVYVAGDGRRALEIVEEHPEIRLVITDYTMPEMDGFELVHALRKRYDRGRLAIIGTAGRGNATIATRFLKEGAGDFLAKPFWNEEFYQRISQNIEIIDRLDRLENLNATKNRFIGMAAHDLRSPIGGIINALELVTDGYLGEVTPEQREVIETIHDAATGMFSLINDLLDVSSIEAGSLVLHREELDLRSVLAGQIRIHTPGADRKEVTLVLEEADGTVSDGSPAGAEVMVTADRRALEQIIANLVSNAIKYTKRGTTVTVRIEGDGDGDRAGFSVTDEGYGIPREERNLLFAPFSTISTRPTGGESSHGLGLAIVHRLVSAHDGTVEVSSEVGRGSTFLVRLPR